MGGSTSSRRSTLSTVAAWRRRVLPALLAAALLAPSSAAFAAQPAPAGAERSRAERPCLLRCLAPSRPTLPAPLQEPAARARAVLEGVRSELQEARAEVREEIEEARADAREVAPRTTEALERKVEEVTGGGPAAESTPPPATQAQTQPAPARPAAESAPAATPPQAAVSQPPQPAAPAGAATGPSLEAVARPGDGVAGGPGSSIQRAEPGTLGQGRPAAPQATPEPTAPAAPSMPAAPAVADLPPASAPAATAPAPAMPAPVVAEAAPPPPGAEPEAPAAGSSPIRSDLEGWSLPLALAGTLLVGLALLLPRSRRPGAAPGTAAAGPGRGARQAETVPGRVAGSAPAVSPSARLHGVPIPYLTVVEGSADAPPRPGRRPAEQVEPGYATDVDGLAWGGASTDTTRTRGERQRSA